MEKITLKAPIALRAAAEEFGINEQWLRRAARGGRIRGQQIGVYWFVEREDVAKVAPVRHLIQQQIGAGRPPKKGKKR